MRNPMDIASFTTGIMSTHALGWSLTGADKMAQLRAYHLNGGSMLELVRYQT